LFARIIQHTGVDSFWEVHSRSGLISFYGRTEVPGSRAAKLAAPGTAAGSTPKVFSWHLVETRDTFGNRIVYEYEKDTFKQDGHNAVQLYLRRVRYVDLDDAQASENGFLISVEFVYEARTSCRSALLATDVLARLEPPT
jgi:hypothetical protein